MDKNTYTLTSKFECCGKTMVTVIIEGRAASVLSEFEYNTIIETERKYYQDKIKSRAGNLTRIATEYQYILNEINTVKNKYIIVSFEKDWWENIPYGLAGREVLYIPIEDKGTSKYWSLCIKILGLKKYDMPDINNKMLIPRPISMINNENCDIDDNIYEDNENIDDFCVEFQMDLSPYYNYRGGSIPQIEMLKYQMTCEASQ